MHEALVDVLDDAIIADIDMQRDLRQLPRPAAVKPGSAMLVADDGVSTEHRQAECGPSRA